MRIRPATIEDLPAVMDLIRECISVLDENGIAQWDAVYSDELALRQAIGSTSLYVFDDDGRVCGTIALNEHEPEEYRHIVWNYRGNILVVHRLAIAPAYQRNGLATRLMEFAEDLAWMGGYDAIRLDVFAQNPAPVALCSTLDYRYAGNVIFRRGLFLCFEKHIKKSGMKEPRAVLDLKDKRLDCGL